MCLMLHQQCECSIRSVYMFVYDQMRIRHNAHYSFKKNVFNYICEFTCNLCGQNLNVVHIKAQNRLQGYLQWVISLLKICQMLNGERLQMYKSFYSLHRMPRSFVPGTRRSWQSVTLLQTQEENLTRRAIVMTIIRGTTLICCKEMTFYYISDFYRRLELRFGNILIFIVHQLSWHLYHGFILIW